MSANHDLVSTGLRELRSALVDYVCSELERDYGEEWWQKGVLDVLYDDQKRNLPDSGSRQDLFESLDVLLCLRLLDAQWNAIFRKKLTRDHRNWAIELIGVRNKAAHHGAKDFPADYTWRCLDTMVRLCEGIDSSAAARLLAMRSSVDPGEAQQSGSMPDVAQAALADISSSGSEDKAPDVVDVTPSRLLFKGRNLVNGDFRDADLTGADFEDAILSYADLRGANLTRANLKGARLEHATLIDATLTGVLFEGTTLRGADLRGVPLDGATLNFRGANLSGANLEGTELEGADFEDAVLTYARLAKTSLGGANLRGADLRRATLSEAKLEGASLRNANLLGADLRKAHLSGADLKYANLMYADLREADLRNALLTEARMDQAKLLGARWQ